MTTKWLARVIESKWYAVSKSEVPDAEALSLHYGDIEISDEGDFWLAGVGSNGYDPATSAEIDAVWWLYGGQVPEDYRNFLSESDGADLFGHYLTDGEGNQVYHFECSLLSTENIQDFHPEFTKIARKHLAELGKLDSPNEAILLNYIPIADVLDGNFVGLSLHPQQFGAVFLLYQGSGYIPYEPNSAVYDVVFADSFTEWLTSVLDSYGSFGLR
jgi:hypothetical protein